jgi:hypothetical protein
MSWARGSPRVRVRVYARKRNGARNATMLSAAVAASDTAACDGPLGMITQAIRETCSSQEVYVLLTTYLRGARLASELVRQSQEMTTIRVTGLDDVKSYAVRLFSALQSVSETLDDRSRVAVKEALYVFGAALDCLDWHQNGQALPAQSAPDAESIC